MNSSIPVILQLGGQAFTHNVEPKQVWSYCQEEVPFGMDHDERIHIGSVGSAVTLHLKTCLDRRNLAQAIADERMERLRVFDPIIGLRLVIYERGWPSESPRRVLAEHRYPEDGVTEYLRTFTARPSTPGVILLAAGWHQDRRVGTLLYENMESISVEGHRVVITKKDSRGTTTLLTNDAETARKLTEAIRAESVGTVEVNEFVRGFIIGMSTPFDRIVGFDNLSLDDQQELREAGAENIGGEDLNSGRPMYIIPNRASRGNGKETESPAAKVNPEEEAP